MKALTAGTLAHLAGEETTLATCCKILTGSGVSAGFTSLDVDLTISGLTYSSVAGYIPTNVQFSAGLGIDNLDVQGLLSSVGITDADIQAGVYDNAEVWFFMVNYDDVTEIVPLSYGVIGEIRSADLFVAEVRSLSQLMAQTIGDLITVDCKATLGDSQCKIVLSSYTVSSSVTAATDRANFTDTTRTEADDYFKYGLVTWTSGLNSGYSMEVKSYTLSTGAFELFEPMPYAIAASDTFTVYKGCDKSASTCKNGFSNLVNFRGFPNSPTLDQLAAVGGQ